MLLDWLLSSALGKSLRKVLYFRLLTRPLFASLHPKCCLDAWLLGCQGGAHLVLGNLIVYQRLMDHLVIKAESEEPDECNFEGAMLVQRVMPETLSFVSRLTSWIPLVSI